LQRALETIERNARNQQQIIEDLLDVSRIITGKLRLEIRPVEIASLIAASVDSFNPAAAAKAVSLEQRLDPQLGSVELDPARIQQIVWNLLSNAIKFTPPGGSVKIVLERVDSELVIAISDTGQGITAEFLPFVFDRFRQADSTTTRKHGGLGLGLAIVRNLVELHGGSVRADSAGEGCGSTFIVRLPLRRIDQRIDIQQKILSADGGQVAQFESEENLNGLKVLIVDDEADTCELLKAVLERCHAHVETAQSVREALEKLPVFLPDILISDIGMPDEDGYDLIRRVRRLPRERGGDVPAVALTAYATINDRLRVLREGYQMHIPKPLELAELVTVVTSLARRKLEARGDES
jgi:CheY-like chemotaxis protein/two-component sensor histidine kinase